MARLPIAWRKAYRPNQIFITAAQSIVVSIERKKKHKAAVHISRFTTGSAECSSVAQGKLEYACLEEVSALTTSSACSIDEFLASGDETTVSLFDELQSTLSSHQGEMVLFARELRQRFHTTMEQTQEMFEYTSMFFQKLMEESKNSESRVAEANNSYIKQNFLFSED
ncbi:hypothetical protein ARALYDRAFT_920782 [Arabidopsis lyrata subsp. lyrata]|uniref:Uncharacterized protein n=1 Tax=Arabidopsis lyrata subsp. lyrata TaxID=81972 RepID=D7MW10_ARALL|nr:hypothetical protein ARALYDRAFT_920782 [Arabidopsis lyrata subsp. lyrata]